ncbi:MAG: prepilin-type N-terminal cleavage/methylation domain-containing protein [Armatimonadetes bacterium]|nr:prepilin-type N-terminal cleavage/methylation domain-containing protein [Akkermansiaceae bacterium]
MQSLLNKTATNIRHRSAFSLIELLTVMAIISILLVATIPIFSNASNNARQASREIVKAHLQQARAHAIATGNSTAVAIPVLGSGKKLGSRGISLFEVENNGGTFTTLKDAAGKDRLLQRWETLPGNIHFLSSSQVVTNGPTVSDSAQKLATNYNEPLSCSFIAFSANGQISHPPSGTTIQIALAQAVNQGGSLKLTQRNRGQPIFDLLRINRLTGRTRSVQP